MNCKIQANLKTIMKQQHSFAGKAQIELGPGLGTPLSGIPDDQFQPPRKKQKQRLEIDLSNWL
jgi:hypothetical protein